MNHWLCEWISKIELQRLLWSWTAEKPGPNPKGQFDSHKQNFKINSSIVGYNNRPSHQKLSNLLAYVRDSVCTRDNWDEPSLIKTQSWLLDYQVPTALFALSFLCSLFFLQLRVSELVNALFDQFLKSNFTLHWQQWWRHLVSGVDRSHGGNKNYYYYTKFFSRLINDPITI